MTPCVRADSVILDVELRWTSDVHITLGACTALGAELVLQLSNLSFAGTLR